MIPSLVPAATILAGLSILCLSALRGWSKWLAYRRLALDQKLPDPTTSEGDIGLRIELAALRERVKQLERIASGVEL